MLRNEFMMPQTVPNRPMNGAALAGRSQQRHARFHLGDGRRARAIERALDALDVAQQRSPAGVDVFLAAASAASRARCSRRGTPRRPATARWTR
jgi:hypothetical protein